MTKFSRLLALEALAFALLVAAAFLIQPASGPFPAGRSAVDPASVTAPDLARAPGLAGRGGRLGAPAPAWAGGDDAARAGDAEEPVAPGQDVQEETAADEQHSPYRDGLPLTLEHPLVLAVARVQERRTADLLANPLVVGTAIGMNERGEIALVVLTKGPIANLPTRIDDVPVLVHESGELFASKGKPGGAPGGGTTVDPTARLPRPVPIGVSTGHPDITAGTIGCRVRTAGGQLFALSNNHVYAHENLAILGDPALQPGAFDGGASPIDEIGVLHDFAALDFSGGVNTMDAAIVLSDAAQLGHSTLSDGYGRPKTATLAPAIGLRVQKYGRTTRLTSGRVFGINANVNVGYSTGTAFFAGQVIITPGSFSAGGDSGSLIVGVQGAEARKPVALLMAGSSSVTIGSPIAPILSHFDVTVDGE